MNSSAGMWTEEFYWYENVETLESKEGRIPGGGIRRLELAQLSEADDRRELTCSAREGGQHRTILLILRGITPLRYSLLLKQN